MAKKLFNLAIFVAGSALASLPAMGQVSYCSDDAQWGRIGIDCYMPMEGTAFALVKDRCWKVGENIDPTNPRKDHLYGDQAATRLNWAVGCGYVGTDERTQRLFKETFDAFSNKWIPRKLPAFPTFAFQDADLTIWKPEQVAPGYPGAGSCVKPAKVNWVTICEAGCYERSMQLLFSDGYKTVEQSIEDAKAGQQQFVVTLSTDATLENLAFTETPVSYFTKDLQESEQEILKFKMASGGTLKVTDNHPLIDSNGAVRFANALKVGDKLVKNSGESDEIVEIEEYTYTGRVYNVAPATQNPLTNIVVAEGYLNGSQRYQDQQITDLNRLAIRSSLPAELL